MYLTYSQFKALRVQHSKVSTAFITLPLSTCHVEFRPKSHTFSLIFETETR